MSQSILKQCHSYTTLPMELYLYGKVPFIKSIKLVLLYRPIFFFFLERENILYIWSSTEFFLFCTVMGKYVLFHKAIIEKWCFILSQMLMLKVLICFYNFLKNKSPLFFFHCFIYLIIAHDVLPISN
jgi:hypothetical protein